MKLIDGHAMIQRVKALHNRGAVDLSYYNVVKEAVQMEPAIDAAPAVHGQWLYRRYDFGEHKYEIMPYDVTTFDNPVGLFCSVCNEPALLNGVEDDVPSNYCPNCGAKMDGDLQGLDGKGRVNGNERTIKG